MRLRAIGLAASMILLSCAAVAQQAGKLDTVVGVEDDGSVVCVERLALTSPMNEPLHWRMPTASVSPMGVRRLLLVDVLEVSDGRGNRVRTTTREHGDRVDVLVPIQPLAENTVRLTYEVRNAVAFREDRGELFWRIGAGWVNPLQNLSVNVTVPDAAAGQVSGQFLGGGTHGELQQVRFQGTTAALELPQVYKPALDLVFAPGVLRGPSAAERLGWFLKANPIILLPGVLLLAMVGYRKIAMRGAAADVAIAPRYEAPENLAPAEAGYLIDDRLDARDLAAMLLDLARRGFLSIEACEPDDGVPYSAPDFVLRLQKPMDNWKDAYSYEHVMLFHTFYGGHWTKLSSVSLRFYSVIPAIERMIREELQKKQLYVDPRLIQAQRIGAVLVLAAVLWAAQAAGWFAVAQSGVMALIAIVSFVLVVPIISRGENHHTAKGKRVFAELRGFEMFLDSVEADRMERVTPELFEKFLPYAVAFNVEHRWGATFSTISSGPPLWWQSGKGGIPDFVHVVGSYARPSQGIRGRAAAAPVAPTSSAAKSS